MTILDGDHAAVLGRIREGQPFAEIIEMLPGICYYEKETDVPEHVRQELEQALRADEQES